MGEKIDREKYTNEWILVCEGTVIKHSKNLEDILSSAEHDEHKEHESCYVEKVLAGMVCFY